MEILTRGALQNIEQMHGITSTLAAHCIELLDKLETVERERDRLSLKIDEQQIEIDDLKKKKSE